MQISRPAFVVALKRSWNGELTALSLRFAPIGMNRMVWLWKIIQLTGIAKRGIFIDCKKGWKYRL